MTFGHLLTTHVIDAQTVFGFRLPIHVAAMIAALCDLYPQKSRGPNYCRPSDQRLKNLKNLPEAPGDPVDERWNDEIAGKLQKRGNACFILVAFEDVSINWPTHTTGELETELGNTQPSLLSRMLWGPKPILRSRSQRLSVLTDTTIESAYHLVAVRLRALLRTLGC